MKRLSIVLLLALVGCSENGKSGFEDISGGLTNYAAACAKHGGLDRVSDKGHTVYLYCKNGKKLTHKK
ncbi:hypothetical protein [Litoribacillus peritrichatus]|uniref:Lipoprotein n=1 Tax=Litoribacillus peritrichatus TaxID=718191 RepID=A0ABP7M994_9GAMM